MWVERVEVAFGEAKKRLQGRRGEKEEKRRGISFAFDASEGGGGGKDLGTHTKKSDGTEAKLDGESRARLGSDRVDDKGGRGDGEC